MVPVLLACSMIARRWRAGLPRWTADRLHRLSSIRRICPDSRPSWCRSSSARNGWKPYRWCKPRRCRPCSTRSAFFSTPPRTAIGRPGLRLLRPTIGASSAVFICGGDPIRTGGRGSGDGSGGALPTGHVIMLQRLIGSVSLTITAAGLACGWRQPVSWLRSGSTVWLTRFPLRDLKIAAGGLAYLLAMRRWRGVRRGYFKLARSLRRQPVVCRRRLRKVK